VQKALPPVVIGPVVAIIGLSLAPTAIQMATQANGAYSLPALVLAALTIVFILTTMFAGLKFLGSISILVGLVLGYVMTIVLGGIAPAFQFFDPTVITEAPWVNMPKFVVPQFNLSVVVTFALVSFATICEHIGHTIVTGDIIGRDVVKDPGLHATVLGDGVATAVAGLFGSVSNTTYGESLGVMATTKVYDIAVFVAAAILAVVLSLLGKFGGVLQGMPTPVLGGACILLYGTIAVNGLKQLIVNQVDFDKPRNMVIASVVFVLGCGGALLNVGEFQLTSIAFAAIVGIVMNSILPK
jgi:uracil permease